MTKRKSEARKFAEKRYKEAKQPDSPEVTQPPDVPHEIIDTATMDRVTSIMGLIAFGMKATDICRKMISEKHISWATAWRDYRLAREELGKLTLKKREDLYGQAIEFWNTMIQAGMGLKNEQGRLTEEGIRVAMIAAERRDKIAGLSVEFEESRRLADNGQAIGGPTNGGQPGTAEGVDEESLGALAALIANAAGQNGELQPPSLDAPQHQAG